MFLPLSTSPHSLFWVPPHVTGRMRGLSILTFLPREMATTQVMSKMTGEGDGTGLQLMQAGSVARAQIHLTPTVLLSENSGKWADISCRVHRFWRIAMKNHPLVSLPQIF